MTKPDSQRVGAVLAGIWAGLMLGVALIGTPAGFALTQSPLSGQLAGFMLAREAQAGIVFSVLLFVIVRAQARRQAVAGSGSVLSANVVLVLAALFCTVLGHYGVKSAMDAARAGEGWLSFGALHAISVVFFGVKILLVITLAWRLTARAKG